MTQNCLQIVDWLKSWFTPKDEDYHYDIVSSDYNPDIDSTVLITVTVTDGNDNPVTNHSFELNANGSLISRTTDSNGEATYHYTCSDWGICRFSVKSFVAFINVGGWRTATNTADWKVMYNQDTVKCAIHISGNLTYPTGWTLQNANILGSAKDTIKPSMPVTGVNYVGSNSAVAIRDDGGFYKKSLTGSQLSVGTYCQLTWTYK